MSNTDLTRFNLSKANFQTSIIPSIINDDAYQVIITNLSEQMTFIHSAILTHDGAILLMKKIRTKNIVNLILWDTLPEYFILDEEDALAEQLAMQEAEFINDYIIAGGDQFDAKTEWNTRQRNLNNHH
jgi:hypothetical protein